jgi:hypothetical protein
LSQQAAQLHRISAQLGRRGLGRRWSRLSLLWGFFAERLQGQQQGLARVRVMFSVEGLAQGWHSIRRTNGAQGDRRTASNVGRFVAQGADEALIIKLGLKSPNVRHARLVGETECSP